MPRLLLIATTGTTDPTKASIPLHIAVNGAREAGMEAGLVLAGEAAALIQQHIADQVVGVGVPPLKELLAGAVQKGVEIYV